MTKQFTKDDMREEYGVKLRNGEWHEWYYLSRFGGEYEDSLKYKNYKHADIMLVVDTDGNVLFKREEPETVLINGIEVPMPISKPLKYGQYYYCLDNSNVNGYSYYHWHNSFVDHMRVFNNAVHLDEDSVRKHVKALRSPFDNN